MKDLYSYMGIAIMGTGLMHCFIGLLYNRPLLSKLIASIIKDGGAASMPYEVSFFFWFEISGLALILLGVLVDWLIRVMNLQLPLLFCIGFVLLGILATIFAPKSGSWLILIQSIVLLIWR